MHRYTNKLEKIGNEKLDPGETILIGLRAKAAWNISAAIQGGLSGASSGAVSGASGLPFSGISTGSSKKEQETKLAEQSGFPYPGSMAIALTNKRLLVWKRSILFGYLQEYQGDYQINKIDSIKLFNEKGLGDRLLIKLTDSHTIRIYAVRKDGTKDFVEQLKNLINKT